MMFTFEGEGGSDVDGGGDAFYHSADLNVSNASFDHPYPLLLRPHSLVVLHNLADHQRGFLLGDLK